MSKQIEVKKTESTFKAFDYKCEELGINLNFRLNTDRPDQIEAFIQILNRAKEDVETLLASIAEPAEGE